MSALSAARPLPWWRRLAALRVGRWQRQQAQPLGDAALRVLDAVLAEAGVIVIVFDAATRCQHCNAEAARVAGLAAAPGPGVVLAGRLPDLMLHGPDQAAEVETWQTPAGPRQYRVSRGSLPGEGASRYVVARDVTDQRQHAERLAHNEQQLSLALRGAALGLWDWQVGSGAMQINERWAEMLGYRVDEIAPHLDSWRALVHPDDWATVDAALAAHLRGDTDGYRCEHRLRHRDGHWVWVLDAGQVVERDALGRPVRALGIHLDVSERRAATAALEQSRRELELRVQERTAALAEATAQARAASDAKTAFLANISHEIRTPMNAIVGLTRLMAMASSTDAQQADRIAKIDGAASHLMMLIGDVLDLSKIEAGHMTLEQLPLALPELLAQSLGMFGAQVQAKGLALRLDAEGLPEGLLGDPTRLRQALLNLVGNAVKFTEQGEVSLSVSVLAEDAVAVTLRFDVSDTGPGVDGAVASRLFSAFEQGEASIARRHGGTGLGLAITRRIAEMMDGEVGVQSRPGEGARFWFTARLLRDQRASVPASPGARLPAVERLRLRCHGRRVLLVEDNPVNQEIALAVLAQGALQVTVAGDGASALHEAAQGRFDAVLMDLHLPDLDGTEITRRLRAAGLTAPVLALTASATAAERAQCERLGMAAFLTKPLQPEALHQALLEALDAGG